MRWFLWLVLVIALVSGALYGVGRFLLPNDLAVTRTVAIERPRAAVFAMANDLRIAKEWSPYYAMDPDAEYAFSGEGPGAGQTMRWISTVRQVGSGRISIVDSAENESIDSIIELGERATMNSRFEVRRAEGGSAVAWSVSARCAEGAINVPCRYMNLILQSQISTQLDAGLTRLKTLAEQLPNVDFERLQPQFDAVEPQMFVYSVVETSASDLTELNRAEALGISQVQGFMAQYGLTQAGPLTRVVTASNTEGRMSFRVGYPYSGATPLTVVGVQIGQTPSGQAVHILVEGTRQQVQAAYAQLAAYLLAHRIPLREGGEPWEVVHRTPGEDGVARIEIFVPLQ
jgi:hypothetical protein